MDDEIEGYSVDDVVMYFFEQFSWDGKITQVSQMDTDFKQGLDETFNVF